MTIDFISTINLYFIIRILWEEKMLFDVLMGVASSCLIVLCMLYPLRRRLKGIRKINKLQFHCVFGCLTLAMVLIHSNSALLNPYISTGFLSLLALVAVVVTGFLKRRFMKSRQLHYIHVGSAAVFITVLIVHIVQQVLNLLLM
jgi:hypothetical protein